MKTIELNGKKYMLITRNENPSADGCSDCAFLNDEDACESKTAEPCVDNANYLDNAYAYWKEVNED